MEKMTRHPLHEQEDALKRALMIYDCKLIDDGLAPQLESTDWAINVCNKNVKKPFSPILVEKGTYALRSELLAAQLSSIRGPLPIKVFAVGTVYDGEYPTQPAHTQIEGIWASDCFEWSEYLRFWTLVSQQAFGIGVSVSSEPLGKEAYVIKVTKNNNEFILARTGVATEIARALLSINNPVTHVQVFTIDVDEAVMGLCAIPNRAALYDPKLSFLKSFTGDDASFCSACYGEASNVLRRLGFFEFCGLPVYEADCYKKMNMIQENWDTNNEGVTLDVPLGNFVGLPTVLTPALEEALASNYKAGEESCRLFEIRHIFLPGKNGSAPTEKIALSFGAYGSDLDKKSWKALVDTFFNEFGIQNRFYIPTDMAIAYDQTDCWLVMDQNMNYLQSNFGTISPIARKNHGIGVPAFMAQFEVEPLEKKAAQELVFVAPELK